MRTIALRFGENFAPECGTIKAHEDIISENGFAWYGKMGSRVSQRVVDEIMHNDNPRILLIRSGKTERYWAYIEEIQYSLPKLQYIPDYYRDMAGVFKTWFKVKKIVMAEKNVMKKCTVASSKAFLVEVSKHSMSPYFIIDYEEMKE